MAAKAHNLKKPFMFRSFEAASGFPGGTAASLICDVFAFTIFSQDVALSRARHRRHDAGVEVCASVEPSHVAHALRLRSAGRFQSRSFHSI